MRKFAGFYLLLLIVTIILGLAVPRARGADCGPMPQEPETPAGCLWLRPVAAVSADGRQCRIVWVCARLTPDLEPRFPRIRRGATNVVADDPKEDADDEDHE